MKALDRGRQWPEDGGATVLAAAAVGAVVLLLTAAVVVVSVVHDVHRARAAADLAALAAAGPLVASGAASCPEGGSVARANGATLSRCEVLSDGSVAAGVTVPLRVSAGWAGLPGHAGARARAGVVTPAAMGTSGGPVLRTSGPRW